LNLTEQTITSFFIYNVDLHQDLKYLSMKSSVISSNFQQILILKESVSHSYITKIQVQKSNK